MKGPRWIKQWIADLALLNEQFRNDDGSVDFEALGREEYMFRTALITQKFEKSERARDTFMKAKAACDASSENGKMGGRPRNDGIGPMPDDVQAVYDFASDAGLDNDDAYECWYVTVNERNGLTADGKEIKNWKSYIRTWCRTRKSNRR